MLSVIILTKNEEKNIIDCLETILWVDEIIVVDDYSTDRTVEIIEALNNKKIKIYKKTLGDDFSKQRNFGLQKTTKKWTLFIDADERVSNDLHEEINSIIINSNNSINGYFLKRNDFMWNKMLKHGELADIRLLRLAKKESGKWTGAVHEVWNISGKTSELDSILFHYPHPTISEFLGEINFYSTLRANELFQQKINPSLFDIIVYPKAKFFLNYFLKLGFLDGIQGLVFAIMMSFYSFLVRSKLWLYQNKK